MQVSVNAFYFFAGAIFGRSAVLLTLMTLVRLIFRLQDGITAKFIHYMCWLVLLSGTVVGYAYCMELFMSYYSGIKYEGDAFMLRALYGPSAWYYWTKFFCNVFVPQLFWFKWVRKNLWAVLAVSLAVNIDMLYESYVTVVTTWYEAK